MREGAMDPNSRCIQDIWTSDAELCLSTLSAAVEAVAYSLLAQPTIRPSVSLFPGSSILPKRRRSDAADRCEIALTAF